MLKYIDYLPNTELARINNLKDKQACVIPLEMLKGCLTIKQSLHIAKLHGITKISR